MVPLYDTAWWTKLCADERSENGCVGLLLECWILNIECLFVCGSGMRARVWWMLLKMTRISVQEAAWMWHIRVTRSSQLFIHIDVRHYPFNKFNSFHPFNICWKQQHQQQRQQQSHSTHSDMVVCLFAHSFACLLARSLARLPLRTPWMSTIQFGQINKSNCKFLQFMYI